MPDTGNLVEDLFFEVEKHLTAGDVEAFARVAGLECLLGGFADGQTTVDVDRATVDGDVEDAASARLEAGLGIEFFVDLGCQTGSAGLVVSLGTVFNGHFHRHLQALKGKLALTSELRVASSAACRRIASRL